MCANIGVDPLASNKGMWAQLLGFGDFYYELGVQVVEACLATRAVNGGLMDLSTLSRYVQVRAVAALMAFVQTYVPGENQPSRSGGSDHHLV